MPDRQQPRLERVRLSDPVYLVERFIEIHRDYRGFVPESCPSWLREIAAEMIRRADLIDRQPSLF